MSDLTLPSHGLFFGSILYNEEYLHPQTLGGLWGERFGHSVEFSHHFYPMKSYYAKQMGEEDKLKRVLLASLDPRPREELVEHKLWADALEKKLMAGLVRPLNLDVGLLTLENMVLATGKGFAHRIYLDRGVYADLNLLYEQKKMKPLSWTYPDYSHPDFLEFFKWLRGFLYRKNCEKNT